MGKGNVEYLSGATIAVHMIAVGQLQKRCKVKDERRVFWNAKRYIDGARSMRARTIGSALGTWPHTEHACRLLDMTSGSRRCACPRMPATVVDVHAAMGTVVRTN